MIAMLLVAVAGGLGAVSRFILDGFIRSRGRLAFPLGTMIINVTGALLLGLVSGLVLRGALPVDWRVVGGIGFLGGYTTFSTASFETVRLLQERRLVAALLNGLGMLVLACVAAGLGLFLGTANFA
jgi:fluoride exporter